MTTKQKAAAKKRAVHNTGGADEEKSYPFFMVVGMGGGTAIGEALLGSSPGWVIGFVVGGGIGKAIDDAIKKRKKDRGLKK